MLRIVLATALIALAPPVLAPPALAHQIEHQIADCACNAACYTDEVSAVRCTNREVQFQAGGFPDPSHPMMTGITGSNQQYPRPHSYRFGITRSPALAASPTATEPGAIGVAVNGVPIFDPSTQGPPQADGKPISAADAGELDSCGGHAGRGDDYHYHQAPNCLIEELGRAAIEDQRRPIGFAADGFPILALGWFDRSARIEDKLDQCRGAQDAAGRYFYNAEPGGHYAVLDCYSGTPRGFARDTWDKRRDAAGAEITGIPIPLTVTGYQLAPAGGDLCSVLSGRLREEVVTQNAQATRIKNVDGALFYCSQSCYGHFTAVKGARPRTLTFEARTEGCPAGLSVATQNDFLSFQN